MIRGLYAPSLQVEYECTSGACTWPSFHSLAMCSSCSDVSEQMSIECTDCEPDMLSPNCTYTLPGGFNASIAYGATFAYGSVGLDVNATAADPTMVLTSNVGYLSTYNTNHETSIAFDENSAFAQLSSLRLAPKYSTVGQNFSTFVCGDGAGVQPKLLPSAYQCTFAWCANFYSNTHFSGGNLNGRPTSTSTLKIADPNDCIPGNNSMLCPAFAADQDKPPAAALKDPNALPSEPPVYWLSVGVTEGLRAEMRAFNIEMLGYGSGIVGDAIPMTVYTANSGNISQTMQDVATSITNGIRVGPEATNVVGTATYPVAYIQVRWAWLVYLASLSMLSMIFLGMSILLSARRSAPVWKSSILAVIFHGITEWPSSMSDDDVRERAGMEKTARSLSARLVEGKDGSVSLVRSDEGDM